MPSEENSLKIGVSQCLLGESVRHDGAHKRNTFVVDVLGPYVEWVAVCPEVEAGLGVPREAMHLEDSEQGVRMVTNSSGVDHTDKIREFADRRVEELSEAKLSGFVLKRGSPSCGLQVQIQTSEGEERWGRGLFAESLLERLPGLPVIEEADLSDPAKRQGFVERAFAYRRLKDYCETERSVGQFAMFHAQGRLQVEAHSAEAYSELTDFISSSAKDMDYDELCSAYIPRFMDAISAPLDLGRHYEVMKDVASDLKDDLDTAAYKEIAFALQDYRKGNAALSVPLTLIRHYVRLTENPRFNGQSYLETGPGELLLRDQL
jgi:uncharacterized protein YbbK (DUF523 family)/uncharacterized protein YbgA (DUF1722 family)